MVASKEDAKNDESNLKHNAKIGASKDGEASAEAMLSAYAVQLALTEMANLQGNLFIFPSAFWHWLVWPLLCLVLVVPSNRWVLAVALIVRRAMTLAEAPFVWDACVWMLQTDLMLLVGLLELDPVACGFWKFNTSFLDPRASCASVLTVQLIAAYAPSTPLAATKILSDASPLLVAAGETVMGLLLLVKNRFWQKIGVFLALLLHLGIAFSPFPNQVAVYSVVCLCRLFNVVPATWTLAQNELLSLPKTKAGAAGRACAYALVASSALLNTNPVVKIDWAQPYYVWQCIVCLRAFYLDRDRRLLTTRPIVIKGNKSLVVGWSLIGLAAFYAFGENVLGLVDVSAAAPYTQIRMHAGSNHLVLPTALLQRDGHFFRGGVVRIESSTSTYLNDLYPSETTSLIAPEARDLLHRVGHVGREFSPTVYRMIGPINRRSMPRNGDPFVKYTIPNFELRRVVDELATFETQPFKLTYSRLVGEGDEVWRKHHVNRTFLLQRDARGRTTCTQIFPGRRSRCSDDELALLEKPNYIARKSMMFFAYPADDSFGDVLPCMD
ncbi:hypothetical protein CTAYLR_003680 [Chrysophaeum taylorii]|uniref:Uncharacterized protein n=1 Tax=Chrysophaeum taylorii TaxID=2483200 RepID=A0AAD7XK05_9STRA|nr:hypothetical protein CTAYLR_003680 [Chrysophaeum taylorii]